jgi:RHS repeat-associated protein
MATATLPGGAVTTFTYAATGLRRKSQTPATTTNFVWDGQDVLLETDANGATQAAYTQTPDQYGALVAQRRSGASSFYHFDALGSTTELSNSGQTVTDTYRYYAFGETKASTGSTANPFGFVGRLGYYNEATLGLQYLRARWYKPAAGRFLSTDPIGPASRYEYAGNGPTAAVDPSGLQPEQGGKQPWPELPLDPCAGRPDLFRRLCEAALGRYENRLFPKGKPPDPDQPIGMPPMHRTPPQAPRGFHPYIRPGDVPGEPWYRHPSFGATLGCTF